jgi:hypothetical protein
LTDSIAIARNAPKPLRVVDWNILYVSCVEVMVNVAKGYCTLLALSEIYGEQIFRNLALLESILKERELADWLNW